LGGFLLLITLGLLAKRRWLLVVPLIGALALANRPTFLIIVLTIAVIACIVAFKRQRSVFWRLVGVTIGGLLISLPIQWPLLAFQYGNLVVPFLRAWSDIPVFVDAYQA